MTMLSTGLVVASGRSPICSWIALNRSGLSLSAGRFRIPPQSLSSGANSRSKSYLPTEPVYLRQPAQEATSGIRPDRDKPAHHRRLSTCRRCCPGPATETGCHRRDRNRLVSTCVLCGIGTAASQSRSCQALRNTLTSFHIKGLRPVGMGTIDAISRMLGGVQ